MKRNCENCQHLKWESGDVGDTEGFCCEKRDYQSEKHEAMHLRLLEKESYRRFPKRCFEPTPT